MLVIAGADRMSRDSLEALTRQARRAEIRLVLLLEHLRGEIQQLLGNANSAAILMQLGNAQEAAAAAEFIGRGHKFVLNQITRQVGKTFTKGTGQTWGTSDSQNTTKSTSNGSSDWSRSTSFTESRSRTWQDSANKSVADSTTDGETASRVYEYTMEPTTIQSLPPTAFVLIETGALDRRVTVGDCNPGIILMDRVSPDPLPN